MRDLGLPNHLFEGWSDKLVAAWRARAAAEYPSDLRARDLSVRLTLLAEIYSRLALTDAQASYDQAIGRFPV